MNKFQKDNKNGAKGEAIVRNKFLSYKNVEAVKDISCTEAGKKDDIDLIVHCSDGNVKTVEVKTDFKMNNTGNLVYEEISSKNISSKGCFARTKAEHIAYLNADNGMCYIINAEEFRDLINNVKAEPDKFKKDRVKHVAMGDAAMGYLIPIKFAKESGLIKCEIQMQPVQKVA